MLLMEISYLKKKEEEKNNALFLLVYYGSQVAYPFSIGCVKHTVCFYIPYSKTNSKLLLVMCVLLPISMHNAFFPIHFHILFLHTKQHFLKKREKMH